MSRKHIKRCSTSFILKEKQIKITRHHFTPTRMIVIKKTDNDKCPQGSGEIGIFIHFGRIVKWHSCFGKHSCTLPQKYYTWSYHVAKKFYSQSYIQEYILLKVHSGRIIQNSQKMEASEMCLSLNKSGISIQWHVIRQLKGIKSGYMLLHG